MMHEFSGDTVGNNSVQVPFPVQNLTTEVAGDFTLPDYQPEIKRLLRIGVNLLPPNRFFGGGSTEMTGMMDYFVLYVGQDGGIYCAPLSTEYRLESEPEKSATGIPETVGEPMTCLCDLSSEVPVGRVTAPRRLHIRCKVKARVGLYGECPLERGGMEDDPSEEALAATAEVGRLYWGMGESMPLQDDVILAPADGEMRVVCAEGRVMITEATPAAGTVHCRGEVTVKLTLCPAEGMEGAMGEPMETASRGLTVLHRKIPFTYSVEVTGVTPDCTATACGFCTEISVLMEEGHLHVDLGVVCEVRAHKNETVHYVKDLYSTRRRGECRYAAYPTQRALRALNSNFTLSDSLPLSEAGIHPSARVVDVSATAIPEGLVSDPGKLRSVLTGKCLCHLLLLRDGEYSAAEMELPFRYEFDDQNLLRADTTDKEAALPATKFDGGVTVVNCRARMDGERVGIDAELAVAIRSHISAPFSALLDFIPGGEITHRRGEYVVCFPASGDTVWSVAKRYHAPMAALAAANNLPAGHSPDERESLEGVGYLIV